jgi:hypothetical protein
VELHRQKLLSEIVLNVRDVTRFRHGSLDNGGVSHQTKATAPPSCTCSWGVSRLRFCLDLLPAAFDDGQNLALPVKQAHLRNQTMAQSFGQSYDSRHVGRGKRRRHNPHGLERLDNSKMFSRSQCYSTTCKPFDVTPVTNSASVMS